MRLTTGVAILSIAGFAIVALLDVPPSESAYRDLLIAKGHEPPDDLLPVRDRSTGRMVYIDCATQPIPEPQPGFGARP